MTQKSLGIGDLVPTSQVVKNPLKMGGYSASNLVICGI